MTRQGRLNTLLEFVSERGNVSISDVENEFGVSPATARRDLTALAEQRLVLRTRGGAAALGASYELPLNYKTGRQADAKIAIARAAAEFVSAGDAVGINGGTTTTEVARELARADRLRRRDGEVSLSIVTNALNIGYELSVRPHVRIIVTGGEARQQSYELVGSFVTHALSQLALDVAIIGVDGLSGRFGATTMHEGEAHVGQEFVQAARRVIVVADSTKMGRATFARMCSLDDIDVLVTDATVDHDLATDFAEHGVEVVVAH